MGVETALFLGLNALQARQQQKQAKREAQAVVNAANVEASNKALEVERRAAGAKTSFLQSGLLLEGSPSAAIESIFTTGQQDVNQIVENANVRSRNIIRSGRNQAFGTLLSTAAPALGGSTAFGNFSTDVGAGLRSFSFSDPVDSFDLGFSASQSFREFGGGFGPGEFSGG